MPGLVSFRKVVFPMSSNESPAQPSVHALYSDHHGWLIGWLRRRLGHAGDAADLAHDTFLRLLVRPMASSVNSVAQARGYLRTVADGLCIDLWRRRQVEQAWFDTLSVLPEAVAPSPESQLIVIETLMQVGTMLSQLPQKAATAFVMAQVDGAKYRDIATELDVSERMVKRYIARGMLECMLLVEAGLR